MNGAARPSLDHPGLLPAVLLGEPLSGNRPPKRSPRDWTVDVTAFLLAVGSGALLLLGSYKQSPVADATVWFDVLSGLVACGLLWWRRRWPVQIAVLTAVISGFSVLAAFATVVALFSIAVHRRFGQVAAVAGLNLLAGYVLTFVRPDPTTPLWMSMTIGALITAGAVAQARQLERTRIAREMHDVLAHRISLISLHAGALEFSVGATPDDVAGSAAVIRKSAHEALEDLREILGVLREGTPEPDADGVVAQPEVERPQPTLADLPGLVAQSRSAGMRLTLTDQVHNAASAPTSVARTAFRVVQEGLTNARKHAPHSAVTVILDGGPGPGLDVEVRSRGSVLPGLGHPGHDVGTTKTGAAGSPGAAGAAGATGATGTAMTLHGGPIPGAGQGLVGLVERTSLIGGRLEHGRTSNGDFRLHAWLPWPP